MAKGGGGDEGEVGCVDGVVEGGVGGGFGEGEGEEGVEREGGEWDWGVVIMTLYFLMYIII